ncbi:type II toxin-antitoxin system PemK/MazF family toxin [Microvirga sp. 2TAF3]|uniref:type II toxin-antitoxin system PemK/MazF family toxin n=1 Tax=Microvirga sp. 2TAF3 TaxID=3233014 RepID=UPI003F9514AD
MPLKYPVVPGVILLCDYSTGFQPPEMVKRRPAVVVSPRLPQREQLCTVVPLSGTPPRRDVNYQRRIELPQALPEPFSQTVWWAKADMLATVSFDRLDLFRTERDQTGRRKYLQPKVSAANLEEIREAILFSLGLGHLKKSTS